MNFIKDRFSFLCLIIIAVTYVTGYKIAGALNPVGFDVLGYYTYLPQTFIHHNLKMENLDLISQMVNKYEIATTTLYQYNFENGHYFTRYPLGMAILLSPFFFIAHIYTLLSGGEADGFSRPYQLMIMAGHFFYLMVGFYFLRKILRIWFSDVLTGIVLLITALFTTLLIQGIFGGGMSHGPLFGLQMAIVYYTWKWHNNNSRKTFMFLGLLIGIAAVCRPTEILIVIIPLLWNVDSRTAFKEKIKLLVSLKSDWLFFVGGFILAPALQMLFWWYLTDSPIYYSYSNYGEGFEFLNPPILHSFFHPRSGLFLYSPVLIFALLGLISLRRQNKKIFLPLLVFILLSYYVIGSWSVMQYGFRAYTQTFGIMAIGLAYALNWIVIRKAIKRILLLSLFMIILVFSAFQFIQLFNHTIITDRASWRYYKSVFGKLKAPEESQKYLLVDRFAQSQKENPLEGYKPNQLYFSESFEEIEHSYVIDTTAAEGKRSINITDDMPYSPTIESTFDQVTNKDHAILKCSFWYYPVVPIDTLRLSGVLHFIDKGQAYAYGRELITNKDNPQLNKWNYFEFIYITPEVRRRKDKFIYYIWKEGKGTVLIDNLKISVYERKE